MVPCLDDDKWGNSWFPGAEVGVGQHTVAKIIKDHGGPFVVMDMFHILTIVGTIQFMTCASVSQRLCFCRKPGTCLRDLTFVFLNHYIGIYVFLK